MGYELATDNQLQTIIKFDLNCPNHLLVGVVTESMNRSLLDGLMKKTIMMQFTKINIAFTVLRMSEEDLFQFCRMKIYESVGSFKPGMRPFIYFSTVFLARALKDLEGEVKAEKRKIYDSILSINAELENGGSFVDLFSAKNNVEREVIKKISIEEKMDPLSDSEKTSFLLYAKGYSGEEIGEITSCSRRTAERRVNAALSKMCGYETSIKKLGLINYRKGA